MLYRSVPLFDRLRVFGYLCYAHNKSRDKDKFGERSTKYVFVGYPYGQKGWRVYDIEKKEYFVSRDVVFYEQEFPFATSQAPNLDSPHETLPHEKWVDDDFSLTGGVMNESISVNRHDSLTP